MFGREITDPEYTFAAQFEADGDQFIYRKWRKGEAYRVTSVDREVFISNFRKQLRCLNWGSAAFLLIAILIFAFLTLDDPSQSEGWPIYVIVFTWQLPFMGAYFWIYGAPDRALARTTPIAVALTRDQARKDALARIDWRALIVAPIVLMYFPLKYSSPREWTTGWDRLWLLYIAMLIGLVSVQSYRKWLSGHSR
jgi:hypothetical protein